MNKQFTNKELEILVDLVDEELGETQNLYDETKEDNIKKRLNTLRDIKKELTDTPITKEMNLGLRIGMLSNEYKFKPIYEFLIHKTDNCYYFDELRDLYDKFDYSSVNALIIQLGNEMYEVKKDE